MHFLFNSPIPVPDETIGKELITKAHRNLVGAIYFFVENNHLNFIIPSTVRSINPCPVQSTGADWQPIRGKGRGPKCFSI